MALKTVLITGANRGLGLELADMLLRHGGFRVIAASRSPFEFSRLESAASTAFKSSSIRAFEFLQLDVTNDASRQKAEEDLRAMLPDGKLHCLVNNAGIYPEGWSKEMFETAMSTNCRGPVALARELQPLLANAGDGQVINVTSGYASLRCLPQQLQELVNSCSSTEELKSKINFDPNSPLKREHVPCYKLSKACLNRATRILASNPDWSAPPAGSVAATTAKAPGAAAIRVNSVDPGWCSTRMGGAGAPRTPRQGAESIFRILTGDPAVIGTGRFFGADGRECPW